MPLKLEYAEQITSMRNELFCEEWIDTDDAEVGLLINMALDYLSMARNVLKLANLKSTHHQVKSNE